MKTDKVQTRLSETIITTSDPQQMMRENTLTPSWKR